MNIQQLNIVSKPILNSLKNTSENEYILNQVNNYSKTSLVWTLFAGLVRSEGPLES